MAKLKYCESPVQSSPVQSSPVQSSPVQSSDYNMPMLNIKLRKKYFDVIS